MGAQNYVNTDLKELGLYQVDLVLIHNPRGCSAPQVLSTYDGLRQALNANQVSHTTNPYCEFRLKRPLFQHKTVLKMRPFRSKFAVLETQKFDRNFPDSPDIDMITF